MRLVVRPDGIIRYKETLIYWYGAICSTMARRWVSRSVTSALRFFQVMKLRARAMLVSRLVISRAASLGLWAPASASRSLRLAAALPVADLDQQLRQALGAQRFEVLRIEDGL